MESNIKFSKESQFKKHKFIKQLFVLIYAFFFGLNIVDQMPIAVKIVLCLLISLQTFITTTSLLYMTVSSFRERDLKPVIWSSITAFALLVIVSIFISKSAWFLVLSFLSLGATIVQNYD